MEKHISDFMVHVDETLEPQQQCELEDFVREQEGVVSACMSVENPHLLTVTYDSDRGHVSDIVHHIKDRGLHASAIGL